MTVIEVLKAASGHLSKHISEGARLDAEVILAQALGVRRLDLYLQFDRPLSEAELDRYRGLIRRRAHGEPVAYLVGQPGKRLHCLLPGGVGPFPGRHSG